MSVGGRRNAIQLQIVASELYVDANIQLSVLGMKSNSFGLNALCGWFMAEGRRVRFKER